MLLILSRLALKHDLEIRELQAATFRTTLVKYDEPCKGNEPCTSYSRTNYNIKMATKGYGNANKLEHTAMNNKYTIAHTGTFNTQF